MGLSDPAVLVSSVVCAVLIGLVRKIYRIGKREPLLPPGPPTVPLLGNLAQFPTKDIYLKLAEWAQQYGGIYSLKIASNTIIVLSSFDAVYQIMEKNGAKTANRPEPAHMLRIFGKDCASLSAMQFGPAFRKWRRAVNELVTPSACEEHMPILLAEVNQLLSDLSNQPENFMEMIQRTVLSLSFSIIFGQRIPDIKSSDAQDFLRASDETFELSAPGEYPPVDLLPILYYIPDRFANNWKSRCDVVKEENEVLWFKLVDNAQKRLRRGTPNGCLTESLLNRAEEWDLNPKTVAYMGGNFLGAATHTTNAALDWFVLLAAIHQGAQEKMREEIDRVIGPDRFPDAKDLPNLPYLRAFLREVLRFRPMFPIGIPHCANEEQVYQGYLIPKDCTIFVHAWATLRNPDLFENPEVFDPERFFGMDASKDTWKKLEALPFGVGRRICPGMYLANRMLELIAASLIWGFEFNAPAEGGLDEKNFRVAATCDPLPFKCDIKPRSSAKAKMVDDNLPVSHSVFERFTS